VRGHEGLGLADRRLMNQVVKWISHDYQTSMAWAVANGTPGSVKWNHDTGSEPIRYFAQAELPGIENVDGPHLFELMLKERETCNVCPVRCKVVVEYEDARYRIESRHGGPEYESIAALGPLCAVTDPVAVAKANELCAAYGLDTISTGGTIAFAMACAEAGLLPPAPGDDFLPRFGDGAAVVASIERIVRRAGLGDLMAEGSARMAHALGPDAEALVVTVRGQELPLHDPRLKNAFGLGYALSATGADHEHNMDDTFTNNPGSPNCARLASLGIPTPLPLFGLDPAKIQAFIYETAFMNFMDCAVICHFYPYEYQHLIDGLAAATGWQITREEIVAAGTRVITMGRLFLYRAGFTAQDDALPAALYRPHATGPIAGRALTPEALRAALDTYYGLMGWDEQGAPGAEALARLGLAEL
jgi:aldehyde:ferredoxin oxidoreductase